MTDAVSMTGAVVPAGRGDRATWVPLVRVVSSSSSRRRLQVVLGLLWLLDAALQYQPYMFSHDFVTQTIEPTAKANPYIVAHSITWAAHVMGHHLVVYNVIFASIQVAIAFGLFCRRTVKPALAASIVWTGFVWWFGEGLGAVLSGGTPLAGVPGAVILYAVIAMLLWPAEADPDRTPNAPGLTGPLGATIPRILWLILWGSFSWYLLLPANRSPAGIGGIFSGIAGGQAAWVKSIETNLASVTAHHGTEFSIVLSVLCGLVALAIFARPVVRPALVVACLLALGFWIAEGFGGIFRPRHRPQLRPILILLAACFWPPAHHTVGSEGTR